jgi:nicotinate-nucleotide adenylyltransferase
LRAERPVQEHDRSWSKRGAHAVWSAATKMKTALFGGTFDPVHLGHLAVARAAAEKFDLDRVYFVPADLPPHKRKQPLTDFQHRFAMLALAAAEDPRFVPSLLDAPTGRPNYSIDTVRRLKSTLNKSDKLYFLIGIDAFKDISTWYKPVELLSEVEFIVVSRPGYSLADLGRALPESLRPAESMLNAIRRQRAEGTIALQGATIHLLGQVREKVSSTRIRASARKSVKQLSRYVPRLVAEYIKKEHLYIQRVGRAEAAHAPKRVHQEHGNLERSKIVSGVERSDKSYIQRVAALRPPTRRSACIRSTGIWSGPKS